MPSPFLLELLGLAGLLAASGFFSGSETAIFALEEVELEEMETEGAGSRRAVHLARHPYRTLATLLMGNMLVNVALSTISTAMLVRAFGAAGLGIAIPVVTVVLLLLGEIVPKSIGLRYRRRLSPLAAPLVNILARLLAPIGFFLERMASVTSGVPRSADLSRAELGTLMEMAHVEGILNAFEEKVLGRILRVSTISVERALVPRVEVEAIEADTNGGEAANVFERTGRNRLPVHEGDLDHVIGVLYLKDLLTQEEDWRDRPIRPLIREPYFVPESMMVSDLFREFQARSVHMAVVVDEHGGMEGIVTMEDLLEEFIGKVHDESDEVAVQIALVGERVWRAAATIELDDLGEVIGIEMEEGEEAVTLAGLMEDELGRVPQVGDRVERAGFVFEVLTSRPNRPLQVRVRQLGEVE